MAAHSSTLAWKIPWMEEPGGLQFMGSLRVGTTERLHFHFSLSCTGEGNGNPLQSSCLENPRDGGAWWAAVYGVAQSRTRLEWLSSSSSIYIYVRVYVRICGVGQKVCLGFSVRCYKILEQTWTIWLTQYILFQILFHYRLLQDTEYSSLC